MVFNRLAILAIIGVILSGAIVVADPQIGGCVSGTDRFVTEKQSCDYSANMRCVDPAAGQCADWSETASGTQKKWTTNLPVGTCTKDEGTSGSVPSCWHCFDDESFVDSEYCAYGKKYNNLADCEAGRNGVDAWGFSSGICTKTTFDTK